MEKLTFEEAFRKLEETVQALEHGNLTLDEMLALYEEGVRLANHCASRLQAAELRVRTLAEASGELGEEPPP